MPESLPVRALVIGCGNIGAGYDLYDGQILTFAKALSLRSEVEFSVSDVDERRAREVARLYGVNYVLEPSDQELAEFDIICICVPTAFHFDLITRCTALQVPLVVCEKPLVATLEEVAALERMHLGATRIMVNYLRRFQPAYSRLRKELAGWLAEEPLQGIEVRYVRGFLNCAGHAFDLLEFLLDRPFAAKRLLVSRTCFDALPGDPTATGCLDWDGVPLSFHGVAHARYSLFELDLYTGTRRVEIRERGDSIRCFAMDQGVLRERPEMRQDGAIRDYMVPVIDQALTCLAGRTPDNFSQALRLSREILTLIADMKAAKI